MRKKAATNLHILRSLRDAYRRILDAAHVCREEEKDPTGRLAFATIIDEYQSKFEDVGRRLSTAERSIPG